MASEPQGVGPIDEDGVSHICNKFEYRFVSLGWGKYSFFSGEVGYFSAESQGLITWGMEIHLRSWFLSTNIFLYVLRIELMITYLKNKIILVIIYLRNKIMSHLIGGWGKYKLFCKHSLISDTFPTFDSDTISSP